MSTKYLTSEIDAFCARYYGGRELVIVPYAYNAIFLSLAIATSQTQVIQIAANADFIALGMRTRAILAASGLTVSTLIAPITRLLITDGGTNEQWTNTSTDIQNYAPSGPVELELPYPRIVSGRSTLNCVMTNYAPAAETYSQLELSIYGVLVRATG
jgi:hypothetical protein